jgi:hypothetical protein
MWQSLPVGQLRRVAAPCIANVPYHKDVVRLLHTARYHRTINIRVDTPISVEQHVRGVLHDQRRWGGVREGWRARAAVKA